MTEQRGRRPAAQAGFTLIEVLLVVALSAVIFAPLMLWVGLAINQQPIIKDGILRTASAGLLGSYFPKDVAVAGKATVSFNASTPSWAADCVAPAVAGAGASNAAAGSGGARQVAMIAGGSDVYKVIYSAAPAADDSAKQSLWRRTCNAATNLLITSTEVFADIKPGTTEATCTTELGDKPCRQITIRVTSATTDRVVTVQGTRRVDEGSLPADLSIPTADIQITSRGGVPLQVELSAGGSSVAPGRTAQYQWKFTGPALVDVTSASAVQTVATFAVPGAYRVFLTVTDSEGLSNREIREIQSSDKAPTAVAVVTPEGGASGTEFTLDGSGSSDPEGSISTYDWIVEYPSIDELAPGVQFTSSGAITTVNPPIGTLPGTARVGLTVTDSQGTTDSTSTSFEITDPSATTTTLGPGGSTTTTINPADPSALSLSFTNAAGPGASGQTFDASATTGIGAGNTASYRWEFGDGSEGGGMAPSHNYPNDGQYNVRVTVTTSDARTATTARVVNVGGAPPPPVPSVVDGVRLVWGAVPGARKYLADFEWRTDTDCFEQLVNQQVAVSPAPSKAIPANPCSRFATSRARVGADANGTVSWSEWIPIPLVGP
jgi:prepilin-type N-terminal cleavage/methylation domain-containing protein